MIPNFLGMNQKSWVFVGLSGAPRQITLASWILAMMYGCRALAAINERKSSRRIHTSQVNQANAEHQAQEQWESMMITRSLAPSRLVCSGRPMENPCLAAVCLTKLTDQLRWLEALRRSNKDVETIPWHS